MCIRDREKPSVISEMTSSISNPSSSLGRGRSFFQSDGQIRGKFSVANDHCMVHSSLVISLIIWPNGFDLLFLRRGMGEKIAAFNRCQMVLERSHMLRSLIWDLLNHKIRLSGNGGQVSIEPRRGQRIFERWIPPRTSLKSHFAQVRSKIRNLGILRRH